MRCNALTGKVIRKVDVTGQDKKNGSPLDMVLSGLWRVVLGQK